METIFALSSGNLPSGVAIIRVSGSAVPLIMQNLCGKNLNPRQAYYKQIKDQEGLFLDNALLIYFKAPHSFTGEDILEFHLHGGKALVARFYELLRQYPHCRMAEPGEFSRRAFLNGKMDLTEAEGLADLIEAETEMQRRLALSGANKKLVALYKNWKTQLITIRAEIEAIIDFSEEEDTEQISLLSLCEEIQILKESIKEYIEKGERAYSLRDGIKIVLMGPPNVGKSSLLNKIAGREAAIVTEQAGTTRDALEIQLEIEKTRIIITDTCGIHQTDELVEKIGIEKTLKVAEEADLILFIEDMHSPVSRDVFKSNAEIWYIGNKLDKGKGCYKKWPIQISVLKNLGLNEFFEKLREFINKKTEIFSHVIPARQRQLHILRDVVEELNLILIKQNSPTLIAEHLRRACFSLGKLTGDTDVEEILEIIFSRFCIGK